MQPCSCWMFGVLKHAKQSECHKRSDWQTNHAPCWPKQMEHQYKFMSLVFYDTKAQKQWILSYASQSIVASVYVFGCRRHSQKWTQMWSAQIVTQTCGEWSAAHIHLRRKTNNRKNNFHEKYSNSFFRLPEALLPNYFYDLNFLFAHFGSIKCVYSVRSIHFRTIFFKKFVIDVNSIGTRNGPDQKIRIASHILGCSKISYRERNFSFSKEFSIYLFTSGDVGKLRLLRLLCDDDELPIARFHSLLFLFTFV